MNVHTKLPALLALASALFLAAGVALDASPATAGEPEVKRVEIEVTARGFVPAEIELVAGVPAELVFTRTTASGCTSHVHIPGLGVEKTALRQDEPVTVKVSPTEPGSYEFLCGMNMLRGTIRVVAAR
jgi:plastocyanin domain-containing protein